MQNFEIGLNQQQLTRLMGDGMGIVALLNELFEPASTNYTALVYELQREFKQGGAPDVVCLTFDRVNYNAASGKGTFRIVLDVRFTFGCEDVTTTKINQTSEWSFIILPGGNVINFYSSPFAEVRSTADEF